MAAPAEFNVDPAADYARLKPQQKLAILLIMLGPESAAQVLKQFDEEELESISAEVAKLGPVSQELQREVLREFGTVVVESTTVLRGGAEFAQAALEKSLGPSRASRILNRISASRPPSPELQKLAVLESSQIVNVLRTERAQTAALVTSCLPPHKASQVLALLPNDLREQVVERLATLGPTPVEVVDRTVMLLLEKVGSGDARALSQTGGVKVAATLLNGMDKRLSQTLLASLEERNPELGQAIRQKMFTFDDLVRLDATYLQRLLREVDLRDLAVALKRANDQLKAVLLGCISKRAAETVNEEISFLGSVKNKEVEAAQLRIVNVLRRLETEGEIELGESEDKEAAA